VHLRLESIALLRQLFSGHFAVLQRSCRLRPSLTLAISSECEVRHIAEAADEPNGSVMQKRLRCIDAALGEQVSCLAGSPGGEAERHDDRGTGCAPPWRPGSGWNSRSAISGKMKISF
jgi:hypothetical protein